MHGICFDYPLQDWFEFKIPKTKIPNDFIYNALHEEANFNIKPNAKIVWLGGKPTIEHFTKSKKGSSWEMVKLVFHDKKESFNIQLAKKEGEWLVKILEKVSVYNSKTVTFQEIKLDFEQDFQDFEIFWYSKPLFNLRDFGLLVVL
jgi:hypothetical protein